MATYEASFEIDSRSDSHAARRILEQVYDTVREESRTLGTDSEDTTVLLREFESLLDGVKPPSPGRLTITVEQHDGGFED